RGCRPAPQKRGRSHYQQPTHGRQPHDETRRERPGRLACTRGTLAVLHPDAAAMRLDDVLGNGEPEARILSEGLVRSMRVEALEDSLLRFLGHARAVVVDDN